MLHFQPEFLRTRQIDLAIATSGYCQARCSDCIWPYMKMSNKILSTKNFIKILDRFVDYTIGELSLNVINEPFTDKGILDKLIALSERNQKIEVIFFSSNWLIPNGSTLDKFVVAVEKCAKASNIEKIHLNATVSGIDEKSYDIQQAGAGLVDAVAPYRPLDFNTAVTNVCEVLLRLSTIEGLNKIKFRIKAYGDIFTAEEMKAFWLRRLKASNIPDTLIQEHVKIMWNEGYTTFARAPNIKNDLTYGKCRSYWLDHRLVIGAQGEVGLCCEDGLRSVIIGNLLDQDLESVVRAPLFQEHLAIATGQRPTMQGHPCRRCLFFNEINIQVATDEQC